ncbi:MAG TPA: dihydropteroate synthase [Acidimicrobiales bacterium]|nr:dihydropteroate synthase [Acidimicrobiales bacterium]
MWLTVGSTRYDVTHRAMVMGILNRTPDSFYDRGRFFDLDACWRRAERLVTDGADVLDVGGVKAGPGPEVGEDEELARVVPAIESLHARFDVPLSCDTWRASVARAAYAAGAVVGNDISGFSDPGYLPAASEAGASVVATHIRLAPRVADPEPYYDDVVADVARFLAERAAQAQAAGIPRDRIMVDAGLDLGKTAQQSLRLLRETGALSALGYPVLLSASHKPFLGALLGLDVEDRQQASTAAHAVGIIRGARVLRVHDARAARRVADVLATVMADGEVS